MPDISNPASPMHGVYLAATTMTFLGIVGTQVGTVFASRTNKASVFHIGLFSNRWIIYGVIFELLLVAAIIYVPFLQEIFGTISVGIVEWIMALSFGVVIFFADELRKLYLRKFAPPTGSAYLGTEPGTTAEAKAAGKREEAA